MKPQPYGATRVRSSSLSTTTTLVARATACRANDDWPKKCPYTGPAAREYDVDPSSRNPR